MKSARCRNCRKLLLVMSVTCNTRVGDRQRSLEAIEKHVSCKTPISLFAVTTGEYLFLLLFSKLCTNGSHWWISNWISVDKYLEGCG